MHPRALYQHLRRSCRSLPATCIICEQPANRGFSICHDCECELPRLSECCRRCGIELNGGPNIESCCASCQLCAPSFDSCIAAFPYASPINKLITNFKFSARFDIGYSLSRILARKFNAHYGEYHKPELLLPVPLHRSRLRSRGFNQASQICKTLDRHCRIPSSHSTLVKVRNTEPQTSMTSATARKANLRQAFAVEAPDSLEGVRHIALVDDVVTTMATVEAISRMLRQRQDYRIDVWCLARASH